MDGNTSTKYHYRYDKDGQWNASGKTTKKAAWWLYAPRGSSAKIQEAVKKLYDHLTIFKNGNKITLKFYFAQLLKAESTFTLP